MPPGAGPFAVADSTDVAAVGSGEIDIRIGNRGLAHLAVLPTAPHTRALFALPNFVRELTVDAGTETQVGGGAEARCGGAK